MEVVRPAKDSRRNRHWFVVFSEEKMQALNRFFKCQSGASLVEYAVALVVVTLVAGFILAIGSDIGAVIDASAGAF